MTTAPGRNAPQWTRSKERNIEQEIQGLLTPLIKCSCRLNLPALGLFLFYRLEDLHWKKSVRRDIRRVPRTFGCRRQLAGRKWVVFLSYLDSFGDNLESRLRQIRSGTGKARQGKARQRQGIDGSLCLAMAAFTYLRTAMVTRKDHDIMFRHF
jgi:hypothetical protein